MKLRKFLITVIAFSALILVVWALECAEEMQIIYSIIGFLVLATILVALVDKDIKMTAINKDQDLLDFEIEYTGPMTKKQKIIKSSNQIEIRDNLERLTKRGIKYEIRINTKERNVTY